MDATCAIQASIHVFSLVRKYVSRILGTYQFPRGFSYSLTTAVCRRSAPCRRLPLFSLSRPNRKPLYAVLTLLRPIPHSPVKARKKAARKPGGLHFGEIT